MIRNDPDDPKIDIPGFGSFPPDVLLRLLRSRKPHRVEIAHRDGRVCATCGRALNDGEPVWVWRHYQAVSDAFGPVELRPFAPHCADCASRQGQQMPGLYGPWTFYATTRAGCGRVMHRQSDRIRRRFVVCSQRCWVTAHNAARRRARLWRRRRRCLGCGADFTARRDARYCSPVCRQRAYRQRRRR